MNCYEVLLEGQNLASTSEYSGIYSVLRYCLHAKKKVPKSHKSVLKLASSLRLSSCC